MAFGSLALSLVLVAADFSGGGMAQPPSSLMPVAIVPDAAGRAAAAARDRARAARDSRAGRPLGLAGRAAARGSGRSTPSASTPRSRRFAARWRPTPGCRRSRGWSAEVSAETGADPFLIAALVYRDQPLPAVVDGRGGDWPARRFSLRCSAPGAALPFPRADLDREALLDPAHNLRVGIALSQDVGGGARRDRSRARQHATPNRAGAFLLGRSRLGDDRRRSHADGAPPAARGLREPAAAVPRLVAGARRSRRRSTAGPGSGPAASAPIGKTAHARTAGSTSTPPSANRCARSPTAWCSSPASTCTGDYPRSVSFRGSFAAGATATWARAASSCASCTRARCAAATSTSPLSRRRRSDRARRTRSSAPSAAAA